MSEHGRAAVKRLCGLLTGGVIMFGVLAASANAQGFGLSVLSSRADMVSGGEALVRVSLPGDVNAQNVSVSLNGTNVTSSFHTQHLPTAFAAASLQRVVGGPSLVGLVQGLQLGVNRLTATAGTSHAAIRLTNYPITGPIFSGPHQSPYICETVQSGLGPPLDSNCSVHTTYQYYYRTTAGTFEPLADPTNYPADLAHTTVDGRTVPYVIRIESGTINRGIYRIAILDDPANAPAGPWHPGPGWNGKLEYAFGGGCGYGKQQGSDQASAVLNDSALSRGYAVATSTLNVYGTGCDDVLSAETMMMVKSHFIEHYGIPQYTIGQGGSGGAMQQYLIAQDYPGLLDAIVPERAFPDGQTLTETPTDSALLNNYFATSSIPFTDAQKLAVSGFGVLATLQNDWGAQVNGGTNSIYAAKCPGWPGPLSLLYNPLTNPSGVRCTMYDSMINYYGVDPKTGFANRPLDNVGVQYGLKALNAGQISVDQFLDLNQHIGGFDVDGNFVAQRTVATLKAAEVGFATGRVFTGKGVTLPILNLRQYLDISNGAGNVHTRFHTFEVLARMLDSNGTDANTIVWTTPFAPSTINTAVEGQALDMMDTWLESILRDNSSAAYAKKVLKDKPAAFSSGCWDPNDTFIQEAPTLNPQSKCNTLYPVFANPRITAGSPIEDDWVKCKVEPVHKSDYSVRFTPSQWARLESIFKAGVCDYAKPGYGQNLTAKPWLSWGPARGPGISPAPAA